MIHLLRKSTFKCRRRVGGCAGYVVGGCAGYVVGTWPDNHATLWPILQAETFKNFSLAEFQDGPSVAIQYAIIHGMAK